MKRTVGKDYKPTDYHDKYLKKAKYEYVVHYLVLSSDRRVNMAMIIPPSQPDIPNTSELRRFPLQTRTTVHGEIPNMTFYLQRPVQNVASLKLVWFELTLNVSKLIEGTGNEHLYKQLIKGVDINVYPSYGDFIKQVHHPFSSSHFHADFRKGDINKYDEHINILSRPTQSEITTTTETTQTESDRKIYNQDVLLRNFNTYDTLNTMYDWLVERQNIPTYVSNPSFSSDDFNALVNAANYNRVGKFSNANGGRYYTRVGSSTDIMANAMPTVPRIAEYHSNIDGRSEAALTAIGKDAANRRIDTIFYEIDYTTFVNNDVTNNMSRRKDQSDGWTDNREIGRGRYYNKGDPVRPVYVAHERHSNIMGTNTQSGTPFDIDNYNTQIADLRGGRQGIYNGRYYTTTRENRVYEFTTNANSVSPNILSDIHTFLAQRDKKFILDTQAIAYRDFLIAFENRTSQNTAVPRLDTTPFTTSSITTTTTGTSTPVTTTVTIPDQEHTLSYFNTSSFLQTSNTGGNNIIPKLDFMNIQLEFPAIPIADQQKIKNKLRNSEVNASYRIKFGACIEGYYRPGLSLREGINR